MGLTLRQALPLLPLLSMAYSVLQDFSLSSSGREEDIESDEESSPEVLEEEGLEPQRRSARGLPAVGAAQRPTRKRPPAGAFRDVQRVIAKPPEEGR